MKVKSITLIYPKELVTYIVFRKDISPIVFFNSLHVFSKYCNLFSTSKIPCHPMFHLGFSNNATWSYHDVFLELLQED